ncbi:MAG: hypothetical protein AMJ95_11535 [Omnitrophica WOR_2 bacterium SM23_72]|nr:MAG: hypothetical protein AMJ95_11535 [Omnitrophica WOR_2 bacterium SM23_72]
MTRSKLSLKNSVKSALLFSLVLLNIFGCSNEIKPTYQENDIPRLVKKICKEEYNLEVTTLRTPTTLWIYAPLEKILHKDYGVDKDKIFDEEMIEKLRNILTTTGRVLISSDNTPSFYALVASDVNVGIDYIIIGNVVDIKKSYAGFIPWMEANRRYLIKLYMSPKAIGDHAGVHVEPGDIRLSDFLAEQIAQRIGAEFQSEAMKKYFEMEKSEGFFKDGQFLFEYSLKKIKEPPPGMEAKEKMLDIIAYCIKTYDFKDFTEVSLRNSLTQDKINLNRGAILGRVLPN